MGETPKRLIAERSNGPGGGILIGVWDVRSVDSDKLRTLRERHSTEYVYAEDYDALASRLAQEDFTGAGKVSKAASWKRFGR